MKSKAPSPWSSDPAAKKNADQAQLRLADQIIAEIQGRMQGGIEAITNSVVQQMAIEAAKQGIPDLFGPANIRIRKVVREAVAASMTGKLAQAVQGGASCDEGAQA